MGFVRARVYSELNLNVEGTVSRDYDPVSSDLQPGLYGIAIGFSCWQDRHVVGPGQITLLIRSPGQQTSQPASAEEILSPSR
jgi:hypothetical protein